MSNYKIFEPKRKKKKSEGSFWNCLMRKFINAWKVISDLAQRYTRLTWITRARLGRQMNPMIRASWCDQWGLFAMNWTASSTKYCFVGFPWPDSLFGLVHIWYVCNASLYKVEKSWTKDRERIDIGNYARNKLPERGP